MSLAKPPANWSYVAGGRQPPKLGVACMGTVCRPSRLVQVLSRDIGVRAEVSKEVDDGAGRTTVNIGTSHPEGPETSRDRSVVATTPSGATLPSP